MNSVSFFKRSFAVLFSGLTVLAVFSAAQQTSPAPPKLVLNEGKPMAVAARNNLYCAGYVQSSPVETSNQIVGGLEEQEQFVYAQNDVVYLNMGAAKGVKVGDLFAVVRPRGKVSTRWTKKDNLGFLVQEVGVVEVVSVKDSVSAARVRTSCDNFSLGDLVGPTAQRTSPMHERRGPLDPFIEPSGKATGRLFMARDGQELLSRDQIVYVDLGAEDNVQVGDRLTVFRPLGEGNVMFGDMNESMSARDIGYQSRKYRGGTFSIQAPRKSGERAGGRIARNEGLRENRPAIRKVVGELVVLNVKEKTATAVITRTAQEIHTGDWVELQ